MLACLFSCAPAKAGRERLCMHAYSPPSAWQWMALCHAFSVHPHVFYLVIRTAVCQRGDMIVPARLQGLAWRHGPVQQWPASRQLQCCSSMPPRLHSPPNMPAYCQVAINEEASYSCYRQAGRRRQGLGRGLLAGCAPAAPRPARRARCSDDGVGCRCHTGPEVRALLGHGAGDGGACQVRGQHVTTQMRQGGRQAGGQGHRPTGRDSTNASTRREQWAATAAGRRTG